MSTWITLFIVLLTYIGIALGELPTFRANRTTITLMGVGALLGSVVNLIVAEVAARRSVTLAFWEYTKSGFIITMISLFPGMVWIRLFIWK